MVKSKKSNILSGIPYGGVISGFGIVFVVLTIFTMILYATTSFDKKIQIKEKYITGYKGGSRYFVVDSDDNVYKLVDTWFLGEFDRGDDYGKITKGGTYRIKGYGIRVPIISQFPRIYKVTK